MEPSAPITQDVMTIKRMLPEGGPINIVGLTRPQLRDALIGVGVKEKQAKMRVNQIWQWLYHWGVRDFDVMTNLSKEFRATLGDGRALPEWISYSPDGLFLIDRPAHIETVTLKITGLREGGGSVTRIVEIDTPTGEIRDRSVARHAYGLSFSDAVERAAAAQENRGSDVNKILQGQQ